MRYPRSPVSVAITRAPAACNIMRYRNAVLMSADE